MRKRKRVKREPIQVREQRVETDFACRSMPVEPKSLNEEQRSVEAIIATETPVEMFDSNRWEMVPEVLLMSGLELPAGRQVPLLDSHNRYEVGAVLGSIREFRTAGDKLTGRVFFAKSATTQFDLVRDGHVTDMSAGYRSLEKYYIPAGSKQKFGGREFTGPMNVVTSWRLKEGSLVPIGADELTKMRGDNPRHQQDSRSREKYTMPPEVRAYLETRGMPKELSDADALKWAADHRDDKPADKRDDPPAGKRDEIDVDAIAARAAAAAVADLEKRQAAERKALKDFRDEVRAQCELVGLEDISGRWESPVPLPEARKAITEELAKRTSDPLAPGIRIAGGRAQTEKHRGALQTALSMRALSNCNAEEKTIKTVFPEDQRAKDAEQFKNASMFDIAVECLRMDGFPIRGLTREQIAICALGFQEQVGIYTRAAGDPGAYHVTGSFPQITRDAINKSMMVGYTEAPSTWRGPMRQAASVADFKTINRIRVGSIPNIPVWPDNTDPQPVSMKDAREPYAVEAYSAELSFSYRLLVNDDMDALSRAPQQFGQAMARTVNKTAWAVVTSNPTMSDGQALFLETPTGNRKRQNLTTGAGAPSVTTLQTLSNLMRQMRGENTPEENESNDILGLQPVYLIGPSALDTTIKQLILSAYDPASANMAYNTASRLMPVIEPLLDVNSATAWYLFASPSQIDTIEVTFLQGQESPVTRFDVNTKNLSQVYYVLQSFGVAPMNHRGVQKHAGA